MAILFGPSWQIKLNIKTIIILWINVSIPLRTKKTTSWSLSQDGHESVGAVDEWRRSPAGLSPNGRRLVGVARALAWSKPVKKLKVIIGSWSSTPPSGNNLVLPPDHNWVMILATMKARTTGEGDGERSFSGAFILWYGENQGNGRRTKNGKQGQEPLAKKIEEKKMQSKTFLRFVWYYFCFYIFRT